MSIAVCSAWTSLPRPWLQVLRSNQFQIAPSDELSQLTLDRTLTYSIGFCDSVTTLHQLERSETTVPWNLHVGRGGLEFIRRQSAGLTVGTLALVFDDSLARPRVYPRFLMINNRTAIRTWVVRGSSLSSAATTWIPHRTILSRYVAGCTVTYTSGEATL